MPRSSPARRQFKLNANRHVQLKIISFFSRFFFWLNIYFTQKCNIGLHHDLVTCSPVTDQVRADPAGGFSLFAKERLSTNVVFINSLLRPVMCFLSDSSTELQNLSFVIFLIPISLNELLGYSFIRINYSFIQLPLICSRKTEKKLNRDGHGGWDEDDMSEDYIRHWTECFKLKFTTLLMSRIKPEKY